MKTETKLDTKIYQNLGFETKEKQGKAKMARKYSPPISPIIREDDSGVELGFPPSPPPWDIAKWSPVERKKREKVAVGLENRN